MVLVPGMMGWAITMLSGPIALTAMAYTLLAMPAPQSAVLTTTCWPVLKPLANGNIMIAATPMRTMNIQLMPRSNTRAVSAPRWMCTTAL